MSSLPFLKSRTPREPQKNPNDKLVNGKAAEILEHHMAGELMEAIESKDIPRFRMSVEAMIMNLFDWEGEEAEKDEENG